MVSDSLTTGSDAVKPEAERKHTVVWRGGEWDRIRQAAKKLGEETHVDIPEYELIRGAVMRRCDEILGVAEAAA